MKRLIAAVVCLLPLAAGCGRPYRTQCLIPAPSPAPSANDEVQVTFLSVGGILVRSGGAAVMTPPLYSNPTFLEVATQEINPDTQLIRRLLPPVHDVRAIIVGHSHYDHAMDIPYIALHKTPAANIYGSANLVRLLHPMKVDLATKVPPTQVFSVEAEAEAPCGPGIPIPGTRFRIQPLVSEHSAQLNPPPVLKAIAPALGNPVRLWRGETLVAPRDVPRIASSWTEGQTFAYLIDVLEQEGSSDVAFRIYYQDSPTRPKVGYPPQCGGRKVDLAVICIGGAEGIDRFPADLLTAVDPRFVIGAHWEDFFNPLVPPVDGSAELDLDAVPHSDTKGIMGRARENLAATSEFALPCPGTSTVFSRTGDTWARKSGTMLWSAGRRKGSRPGR